MSFHSEHPDPHSSWAVSREFPNETLPVPEVPKSWELWLLFKLGGASCQWLEGSPVKVTLDSRYWSSESQLTVCSSRSKGELVTYFLDISPTTGSLPLQPLNSLLMNSLESFKSNLGASSFLVFLSFPSPSTTNTDSLSTSTTTWGWTTMSRCQTPNNYFQIN